MHLIVYVSDCVVPDDALVSVLEKIVSVSQRNNAAADITGLLFCENRHFLQVLEGEEKALHALMARIERDDRHRNIVILIDEPVASRAFPDWAFDTFFIDAPQLLTPETIRNLRDIYMRHFDLNAADLVSFFKQIIDEIDNFKILRSSRPDEAPP